MAPAPERRKRAGAEPIGDCDCCEADCDCADCERCRQEGLQVARDWIPPPARGAAEGKGAQGAKAGKPVNTDKAGKPVKPGKTRKER